MGGGEQAVGAGDGGGGEVTVRRALTQCTSDMKRFVSFYLVFSRAPVLLLAPESFTSEQRQVVLRPVFTQRRAVVTCRRHPPAVAAR